ncbi:S-adenosylmethionine:tRNA ribosyltransferase-isomerase [Riemerella anatipestifer]|nr:S-adenosylmethionine:tRNA ribosyltransferase-isomerase [Riemerella anatipestifer]
MEHKLFKDVIDYFDENDLFIFNNTKVFQRDCLGIKKNRC